MSPILRPAPKASTGISGLDDIVAGGLTERRVFLIEGAPGAGKTTAALQFLLEGARLGEKGLYITLSETDEELATVPPPMAGRWETRLTYSN